MVDTTADRGAVKARAEDRKWLPAASTWDTMGPEAAAAARRTVVQEGVRQW